MSIPLLDLEGLARACVAGELDVFAAEPRLGWTLGEASRVALIEAVERISANAYGRPALNLVDAIALISQAATNEAGLAMTERNRVGVGKDVAVAVRVDGAVCFGIRFATNVPMNPGNLWPELKPWFKALERNRPRLEQWANNEAVVRFPLTAANTLVAGEAPDEAVTGEQLLAAIVAEPDAVAPRLIYADWLVARGDAHGELIQLGERQRSLTVRDPAVDRRVEQLTAAYGERIAGDVAQLAKRYTLERGFVSKVVMAAPTFAKHGERILAQHPITEVELSPADAKGLDRLAKAPAVAGLRGLRIGQVHGRQRAISLDALTGSSRFTALESLSIWTWQTAGSPRDGFARWPVAKLRRVFLRETDCAVAVVEGLADNPDVQLQALVISDRWPRAWTAPLLTRPSLAGLCELRLANVGGLGELFVGAELRELEVLVIPSWSETIPTLPRVRRLWIVDQAVDGRAFAQMLERCPKLEAVQIRVMASDEVEAALEQALALPPEHPLRAVHLPPDGVDPTLLGRAQTRFNASFYDVT